MPTRRSPRLAATDGEELATELIRCALHAGCLPGVYVHDEYCDPGDLEGVATRLVAMCGILCWSSFTCSSTSGAIAAGRKLQRVGVDSGVGSRVVVPGISPTTLNPAARLIGCISPGVNGRWAYLAPTWIKPWNLEESRR